MNLERMKTLKYKVIKTKKQYFEYCNILEKLSFNPVSSIHRKEIEDEMDLLTLLIEKYDEENNTFSEVEPIPLLLSFMEEHKMNSTALAKLTGVSKGLVSDILNYKKGLSKEMIRKLSAHFAVRQEAFNRPYPLGESVTKHIHTKVSNDFK